MKERVLIAISGHAGAGKDTAADYLVDCKSFVKVGLADPLKRICREIFNFSDEQLWGPSERRNEEDLRYVRQKKGSLGTMDGSPSPKRDIYLTPRYALQTLGTEWGRGCYKNVWIDYGLETAQAILDGAGNYSAKKGLEIVPEPYSVGGVVFSDIRFMNEFELVRAAGGFLVRIHRKGANGQTSGGRENHASEAEQDAVDDDFFDAVIYNDGSKEDLYRQLDRVLGTAKEK